MMETLQFLLRHGYAVVFFFVLGEQMGLPVPALPIMLAAGALAGTGRLSLTVAIVLALVASLLADSFWFHLGRRRGASILNLLCRISLEPDSCVRRTEEVFARQGARSLLVAKFVPGLSTAAPPLAGMFQMRYAWFLVWDALGALLWAGAFGGLGYVFSEQLEDIATAALRLGTWLLVLLVGGLVGYIAWKYVERQRFLRKLRIARIAPEELQQRLAAGEEVMIVDLRHSIEFEAGTATLPGALHILPDQLDARHQEIPRDREIVLYCS